MPPIKMTPVRNIHKTLVAVLFTVGVGLLLMGAQTGHRALASSFLGGNSGEDLVQIGKKNLVETAHLPQIRNEGSPLSVHKRPLNVHRSRFGLDGFCACFITIEHPHFGSKALPDVRRPGIYATILAGSSLRGPPCA
ncbi:MAG TPA: hypothetical protein VK518_05985 [Puia sp.]|nr:hypothetical protein [Puia sp.]